MTTLPGLSFGSRPPAMPKVMSAETPASTSACAAAAAAARPMPLKASNDPAPCRASSLMGGSPPRGIEGPSARASDASAATTPTAFNDSALGSMSDSAPRQVPVGSQRPQGEIGRIAVVAQIKDARESRRRIAGMSPKIIGLPCMQTVIRAAPRGIGPRLAAREQSQQRPGGLIGGAAENLRGARLQRIAVVALAPAAVRILLLFEPCDRALHHGIVGPDVRLRQRHEHRPGAVNIIRAPTPEP